MTHSPRRPAAPPPRPAVRARSLPSAAAPRRALAALFCATLLACALGPSRARAQTPAPAQTTRTPDAATETAQDKTGDAARRAPTGSIKGRVLGEDGQPLAHVRLYIHSRSGAAAARQLPPAESDEDGKFVFNELEPGLYGIRPYLPGYTAEAEPSENPSGANHRLGDDATIRLVRGGVITGTVTRADGEPVVGANVRVNRLRTLDNRPAPALDLWFGNEYATDDRGVYRIYGLPAGVYVVAAGGGQRWSWMPPTPFDADAPTYFRSGTLDTAEEVTVRAGQEVGAVDLRYRGERGYTVSGTVVLPPARKPEDSFNLNISLVHAATGTPLVNTMSQSRDGANAFSFDGIADGEYELRASHYTMGGEGNAAEPLRVSVRGADVPGLKLMPAPLGAIGGDLALEPLREAEGACKAAARRGLIPQEVLVAALREEREGAAEQRRPATPRRRESAPDEGGAFLIRTLEPGRYRLDARPADELWYVRAIQPPAAAPAGTPPAAAPSSTTRPPASRRDSAAPGAALDLKPGQQFKGLRVVVAEGAASLSGRVAPAADDAPPLPPAARLRVHLVPAQREQADDALRYYETTPAPDGAFAFRHLAPGRYLVVVREAEADAPARPAGWDGAARARLRREAEAANLSVELEPCRRTTDYALRFNATR
ncbi:MAG TPA: carboxypeptidase-like regulatory domain-containing protein [Pyrinomonadaceae bacterium]